MSREIVTFVYNSQNLYLRGERENYIAVIGAITKGAKVFGLRDRDEATGEQMAQMEEKEIKVLERGQIEDYLLGDDVLRALCQSKGLENCEEKLDELITLRNSAPNIKAATNSIRGKVINWGMRGVGDTHEAFLRYTLAPLIKPEMAAYEELKQIIFASDGNHDKNTALT